MLNEFLKKEAEEISVFLKQKGLSLPSLPKDLKAIKDEGEAFTIAYPIQGLLKYHGLANKEHRTANFPSISLNNDAFFTVTYVKFSKKYQNDRFMLNGIEIDSKDQKFNRVSHQLNFIRKYSKINTKALIISRNIIKKNNKTVLGKGIGTSASAGAAIAHAVISILYDNEVNYTSNLRLRALFSRYLAGSAIRSCVGGIGLWISHPNMDPKESFGIRLDTKKIQTFINDIDLITISIKSKIQTDKAHEIAPLSPFYESWMKSRKNQIINFYNALIDENFQIVGEMSEFDTLQLHAITMTGSPDKNLILWTPETISIMHLTRDLRNQGIPVYFSIDTGPSVVLLTRTEFTKVIIDNLVNLNDKFNINVGKIGGPSKLLEKSSPEAKLINLNF
ncbi:MAG: diphosphomevalonate/mevalonate 3,5-bisphosphate decarboxylase family protein [Promethearchaeota archaeon]